MVEPLDIKYLIYSWVEYAAFTLFIISLTLMIISPSYVITLLTIFLCSFILGKYYFKYHHYLQMRLWFFFTAVMLGLLVGATFLSRFRVSWKIVIILIIVGMYLGYYLHHHEYLKV